MKLIIAGSRTITDKKYLHAALIKANIYPKDIMEIVCGGAAGADQLGANFAVKCNIKVTLFHAEWNTFGKSAGYKRNVEMAEYADNLIALWDGKSKGTNNMINLMNKFKKPVTVYIPGDKNRELF